MARETRHLIEQRIVIGTSAARALGAFFDTSDLASWWHASRAITLPAPLGPFVVQWTPTDFADDVLGKLGGTLSGTVMEFEAGASCFVADAYWHPPAGDPIGPMALSVQVRSHTDGVELTVAHSASGDGPRWTRYFQIMQGGWERALGDLRIYLEGLEALDRSA